jgi:hypothetical protein
MTSFRLALRLTAIAIFTLVTTGCPSGDGGAQASPSAAASPKGLQVAIMSPDAPAIDTTDDQMSLSGVAGSEIGITSVTWTSDKGGQGSASGTENWTIEAIPLVLGPNAITVKATNSAGETHTDTIAVRRESEGKGSVTLSWAPPTQRTDASPLGDLAGYRISYGRMSGIYDYEIDISNPGIVNYVVDELVPGDWYFVLTAYDSTGLASPPSNELQFTLR